MSMRLVFALASLCSAALICGCRSDYGPAKNFSVVPLDDQAKTVSLADFKGKTVLIDFWATYCEPCRQSMPEIQAMWDKYHSKGFEVVSLSPEDRPLVLAFHQAAKTTYPVYLDPGAKTMLAYNVQSIPAFVLIRDGRILWETAGFESGDITSAVTDAMQ